MLKEKTAKMMKDLNAIGAEAEDMQHLILKSIDSQISEIIDKTELKKVLNNSCSQIEIKIDSIKTIIKAINPI